MNHLENVVNPYDGYTANHQLRPPINRFEFYRTTGFELGWLLLRPINIAQVPEEEPELVKQFSAGQKALYFWWFVDAEVTNGGFVQFYYNKKERYIPAVLKGLKHVGAIEMEALISKAHQAFKEGKTEIENARNKSLLNPDLYKRLKGLTALDEEYHALRDKTMGQIEEYARQHPQEFCVDEQGAPYGTGTEQFKTNYEDGSLFEEYTVINNRLEGTYTAYFKTGEPKEIHNYVNGKQEGVQQLQYDNGNLQEKITIDGATGIQKVETFHLSGKPFKLGHFDQNGEKKGVFKEWFEEGALKESCTFVSNAEREGEWVKYWASGYKRIDAICKDGNVKFLNYWNENGEQLLQDGNGLFINEFKMDMAITKTNYRYETEYKDYKRNGLSKQYINGSLAMTREFQNDVEHGWTKSYDEDGKVLEEKRYENGKLMFNVESTPKSQNS